jgi:5,10-methylenetetrahydromethanopterin reductase
VKAADQVPADGVGPVRIGIASGMPDVGWYLDWARLAEACGYDLIGYGDSQCLLPELHVALAATATVTSRALLCPTVTNPVTRHPAVTASAFGALQQLAGGRARYCVGTGDSATWLVHERPARVDQIAEHCRAFRALTSGQDADVGGKRFRLEWRPPPVPLWLAAEGPRMLRLAGEVADGVLMGNGLTEDVVRDNLDRVGKAAVAAGRDPGSIEPWFFAKMYICESEGQAWRDLAWTLAASAHHAFRFSLDDKFVPSEHRPALERLQAGYIGREHNGLAHAPAGNSELVTDNHLTEFLGPRFLLAGPPDRIRERIAELASWGATNLFTSAMFGDPFAYAEAIAEAVLAPLRAGRD